MAQESVDNINNLEQMQTQVFNTVVDLYNRYKDSPYMINRMQTFITNLPNLLDAENKKYEERVLRMNELTMEQDNFFKVYLSKHQYFYMPYNNIYYVYDGKTYSIIKDDDIHHHLLSTITDEGKLMAWKHKTKQTIIKQIKERTLFKSVPETYTIQNVLGFLQTIFESRTEAKYFLTVIGDCVLKKNSITTTTMYFINANIKKLILLIDSIAYVTTGNSIMNNFISKYHESHNITNYRLIKTNENAISYDLIKDALNKIGIDLLCIAAHYSERYINSDNYLLTKADEQVKQYSQFFCQNTTEKIVDNFIKQCINVKQMETNSNNNNVNTLSWKNMHYIWKLYLSSINVPNMLYTNNLKDILKARLSFIETSTEEDTVNKEPIFLNVTSKYLPSVSSFLAFWEKHITIIASESMNVIDDEYEIDEITSLYKISDYKNVSISDKDIIKMIHHYFSPQVEVIDNKYITNISCNLWSKHDDVLKFLETYKSNVNNIKKKNDLISFDELYKSYKSFCQVKQLVDKGSNTRLLPIVSKQFFEKYVCHELNEYIKYEKFVSSEWNNNQ
uniref:Uncharacterized protein n=1 Tax=viral metagenome TaxID=1070528 RepID=A0A6C0I8D6_9ZZZZ